MDESWHASTNFMTVMRYLANDFADDVFQDPANTNNWISDDLTDAERARIKFQARLPGGD